MKLAAVAFAILAQPCHAAEPAAFKGVPLGASEAVFRTLAPWMTCKRGELSDRVCWWEVSSPETAVEYGPIKLGQLRGEFWNDRLVAIWTWTDGSNYLQALAAMRQHFGKPAKVARETYRDARGGTWTGDVHTWRVGASEVRLQEHCHSITTTCIDFVADEFYARSEATLKARASAGRM